MITRISEVKTMVKHILPLHNTANANSTVQHVIQVKNGIMINVSISVKSMMRAKQDIVGILAHVFVRTLDI